MVIKVAEQLPHSTQRAALNQLNCYYFRALRLLLTHAIVSLGKKK